MQDIIPPYRHNRGSLQPQARPGSHTRRPSARVFYTRQTRVSSGETEIIEKTTSFSAQPAPMTRGIEHLTPEAKAKALERALRRAQVSLKTERKKSRDLKRFAVVFVASMFVLATGYVSIDTWMTNSQVKAEAQQSTSVSGEEATTTPAQEGKEEREPSQENFAAYTVAPSLPRMIYIDKIDVAARVLPMGVNTEGAVQSPRNIFDAGWYNGSVNPGKIGAMFINGHASGPTREGLFAYLDRLVEGDSIQIEKGDGDRLNYKVVHTEVVSLDKVDMQKVLLPRDKVVRGLNLMTCTGKWLDDKQTFDKRVIVYAEQV